MLSALWMSTVIQNATRKKLGAVNYSSDEIYAFAARLAKIADKYGLKLQTCAEKEDFTPLGITASACIDKDLIEISVGLN